MFAGSSSAGDLRASLVSLRQGSTLADPSMPPWHLTLHFDHGSLPSLPAESGTLEIWWSSPTDIRTILTSGTTVAVRVRHDDEVSTSPQPIPAVDLDLLNLFVAPFTSLGEIEERSLSLHPEAYAGETLGCVVASTVRPGSVPDANEIVCPTPDSRNIRLIHRWAAQTVLFSRHGTFHGKSLPVELQIAEGKNLFARAELKQLSAFDPADLPPLPPGIDLHPTESACEHVSSLPRPGVGLTSGATHLNQETRPPADAQSASVLLRVLVPPSGHPSQVEVLEGNSADWARSNIERVQHQLFIPAEAPDGRPLTCPLDFRANVWRQ